MTKFRLFTFSCLSFVMLITLSRSNAIAYEEDGRVQIVYLGSLMNYGDQYYSPSSYHRSIREQVLFEGNSMDDALVASFSRSFNGFAPKSPIGRETNWLA